ncbi:osteopetrosis-associated transmembrane protein 1-like [Pomacea canaliculata]|uniref:osteopetrosis-associated transmembrane protein 1-like n=1 Tax=Pomacea canaliculata TaxID=400727 RepID=UPI000D727E28|nr:osteopetrosis-associated transmembrane protein 1-like [Pomacea canaliculata]XP_025097671.1 osteopetrosis-associated transmembrane protein 1-like [Pomacea canaliculata]
MNTVYNLTICFNSSIELYLEESGSLPRNTTVCNDCRSLYKRLNSHFETMWSDSDGHVCMDLIDMMNYTRLMWSAKFNCRRPGADATVLIIITVLMAFLTMLLYLVCRFSAEIRKIQIAKTKRMPNKPNYGAIKHGDMENSLSSVPGSLSSHRVRT